MSKQLLLCVILLTMYLNGYAQEFSWAKRVKSGSGSNVYTGMGFDQSGNPITGGSGNDALSIYKMSKENGGLLLSKDYTGNNLFVKAYAFLTDTDDNIYMIGQFRTSMKYNTTTVSALSASKVNDDYFIVRFDKDGVFEWGHALGSKHGDDLNSNLLYAGIHDNELVIVASMLADSVFYDQQFVHKNTVVPTTKYRNYSMFRIGTDGALKLYKLFGTYVTSDFSFVNARADGVLEFSNTEAKPVSEFDITQRRTIHLLEVSKEGELSASGKNFSIKDVNYTIPGYKVALGVAGSQYVVLLSGTPNARGVIGEEVISAEVPEEAGLTQVLIMYPLDEDFNPSLSSGLLVSYNAALKVWPQYQNHLTLTATVTDHLLVGEDVFTTTRQGYPSDAVLVLDESLRLVDWYDYGNSNSENQTIDMRFNKDGDLFGLLNAQRDILFGSHTVKADGKSYKHMTGIVKRGQNNPTTGLLSTSNMEIGFDLYPNPTHSELHVRLEPSQGKIVEISIADLNGRTLLTSYNEDISVSGFNAGMYIVNVKYQTTNEDFQVIRHSFVKQ